MASQRTLIEDLDQISTEIQDLWLDRYVWQTFSRIAEGGVARESFFAAWVGEQYYLRASMAVRTMVDTRNDSNSLINVLSRVQADPPTYIDPAEVRADMEMLVAAAKQVKQYVNKYVAHIDPRPTQPIPASSEVDAAVQILGDLLKKYTLLIKNIDLDIEPKVMFDWTSVFKEPWLT